MSTYTVKWNDDNDKTITTVTTGVTADEAVTAIKAELQEAQEAFGLDLNTHNFMIIDEQDGETFQADEEVDLDLWLGEQDPDNAMYDQQ